MTKKTFLFFPLFVGLALGACTNASEGLAKPDGKNDAVGRLCEQAGLEPGCDICQEQGWLGDGVCDEFCLSPDPDCQSSGSFDPLLATCEFGGIGDNETSNDLEDAFGFETHIIHQLDVGELEEAQLSQILMAAQVETGAPAALTIEQAFAITDDDSFQVKLGDIDEGLVTWIQWFAGDTEVGVIFAGDSMEIIGKVSDGDLLSCTTPGADVVPDEIASCTGGDFLGSSNSNELESHLEGRKSLTALSSFTELETQQLFRAMVLTGLSDDLPSSIDDAFDLTDDGKVDHIDLGDANGAAFTWLRFFAGDTEVGAVFVSDALTVVAEISDQDVRACQ